MWRFGDGFGVNWVNLYLYWIMFAIDVEVSLFKFSELKCILFDVDLIFVVWYCFDTVHPLVGVINVCVEIIEI